jgi:hypothetical protein
MDIEVRRDPSYVVINGLRIDTAPPVGELLHVIGTPTRVYTGLQPAPVGHRNNHLHIFDALGVYVYEHHYTRRADDVSIAQVVGERPFEFPPNTPFRGRLRFNGTEMPLRATEAEFLEAMPRNLTRSIQEFAGHSYCEFDGFSIFFDARGPRLRSGRRSKRRLVVSVSISWPHDPHGEPVT